MTKSDGRPTPLVTENPTDAPPRPQAHTWQKRLRPWLINGTLIVICFVLFFPIVSTLLLSIKEPEDVRRRPPILLPCDTETAAFDPLHCRFSLDG